MIYSKKEFFGGMIMMAVFIAILIVFFSPVFGGKNGLDYLDNLYNSISKGSANYLEKVIHETEEFSGTSVSVTLKMESEQQAEQTAKLFNASGALVNVTGNSLKVSGDLGMIISNSLVDADSMYHNKGDALTGKYGYNERQVTYNWWKALSEIDKDLSRQKHFKEAKAADLVKTKVVETAYNYYGIEPQSIGDKVGVVIFSLVFYVIYTLWYGFAIMFMFEGYGMELEGH
jgi:hypothetical protein